MQAATIASRLSLAVVFLTGCAGSVDVAASGSSSSSSSHSSSGGGTGGSGGAGGYGGVGSSSSTGSTGGTGGSGVVAPLMIPAPGARDMVHDAKRHRLYITTSGPSDPSGPGATSGTQGSVLAYDLATQRFDAPLLTGGCFFGIDLSPDQDQLLVADHNIDARHNWVYRVDLTTGAAQKIPFDLDSGEGGTFTAVFTSDTRALVSSDYEGSGWVPLRDLDLTSGTAQSIKMITQRTMLTRSADGTAVAYAQSNISDGEWGRYDVGAGKFTDTAVGDWFVYEIAVSRTASQFAVPTYGGLYIYDGALAKKTTLGTYASEFPVGAVYSPVADELYLAWYGARTSIDVYSTTTLQKLRDVATEPGLFESNGNSAFVSGRIRISRDGSAVFATSKDRVLAYPTGP